MSTDDDLGPLPVRLPVDEPMVRRLVDDQFPDWSGLEIRRVESEGWDNRSFRLGDDLLVRLPSAEPYALAVEKEQRWLPVLAQEVPLPIPVPVAQGKPSAEYPHAWSVYGWLEGRPAEDAVIDDLGRFAVDLGNFLLALQRVDPADGPLPGLHNWYRGGPLTRYQREVDRGLAVFGHPGPAGVLWQSALDATWAGENVWFHGDIAVGNLLVRDGSLSAVIDFGTCGVGDPACDLAIAWTLFDAPSRAVFLETVGADEPMIARGRGWALWKALAGYATDVADGEDVRPGATYALDQLLGDLD